MDQEFEVDTRDPYVTELSCGYSLLTPKNY